MLHIETIAELRAACDRARPTGPARRARADDGLPARGSPVAHARGARGLRSGRRHHLRQPVAVRRRRRPRLLPARPFRRSRAVRGRGRRRGLRAVRRGDVSERASAHVGARRRTHHRSVRRGAADAFRRRCHGRHQAVRDRRAVLGVLRPQGRATACGDRAPGRGSRSARRGRGLRHRPRARRPRAVEPQRIPLGREPPRRARAVASARSRGERGDEG